jgi:hypothetical protein
MAFGMQAPIANDFADIFKYDARAGRGFRMDYNPDTREKVPVDITSPPPRFAIDFGSIEVGYGYFSPTGPDLRVVPEGQPLPPQPADKDDKGRRMFRPVFRVKLFGKILDGLREWSSSANVVLEAVDDLYQKFRAAPEAQGGKIPIVELTKTIPLTLGKGQRQTTVYTPCFVIVGWTDRVEAMGARTVSVPKAPTVVADVMQAAVTVATPPPPNWNGGGGSLEDDSIPFGVCWQ